jgi:hypothetical protein
MHVVSVLDFTTPSPTPSMYYSFIPANCIRFKGDFLEVE